MTTPEAGLRGDQEHPSAHRDKVSLAALWAGLMLAPAAWFVALSIGTPLLSQTCYPKDVPHIGAVPRLSLVVLGMDGAALVLAILGIFIAWHSWKKTVHEKPGHGHSLISSGEGRSRFMAMAGMLTSALMAVAVLYTGMLHVLLRECGV